MAEIDPQFVSSADNPDRSGFGDAVLSGLTNDETAKLSWLASKRFPNEEDAIYRYFIDKDGDISYFDENKKANKEFAQYKFGLDAEGVGGNIFPLLQFASEIVPATITLGATAPLGPAISIPATGAANFMGGTAMYGVRAGLSHALDGPELNTKTATTDILISTGFASLPFGRPRKSFGDTFTGVVDRFAGQAGKQALRDILTEGGDDVGKKIAFAQERYGIILTRPEAQFMNSNATQLQYYLSKQPSSQKLWDFYHNRAQQVNSVADEFFEELQTGKYVRNKISPNPNKGLIKEDLKSFLSGKGSLFDEGDLAEATETVLKKMAQKRADRAGKVYQDAFDMPDLKIDIEDVLTNIRKTIDNPNTSTEKLSAFKKMEKALVDANTGQGRNTTELLHEGLTDNFTRLLEGLSGNNRDRALKREVSRIKAEVSNRLKLANPLYKQAAEIYDPSKGHLQLMERSIINALAKSAQIGGERSVMLVNKMFTGKARPKEITDLRRLIQAEDPQAWQNIKGAWLQTQFDDAVVQSVNPLGAPNKFLSKIGIRGSMLDAFPGRGTLGPYSADLATTSGTASELAQGLALKSAKGKRAKVWEAILEPDELDNFVDLMDTMQAVSFIATRSASPTQTLQTIAKQVADEGATGLGALKKYGVGLFNIIPRLVTKGLDDISQNLISTQKEAYEDVLIDALINPKKAKELRQYLDAINPKVYFLTQGFARGGNEFIDFLTNSPSERNVAKDEALLERENQKNIDVTNQIIERERKEKESIGSQIDSVNPDTTSSLMNVPAFPDDTQALPTEDPSTRMALAGDNPDNQLIAMRGIAGLG